MKNKFSLKNEYKKSFYYIKESRKFIYLIISAFFVSSIAGFFIPIPDILLEKILEFIKELLEKTKGMTQFELIRFIFLNNLQSSFFGMVFGFFLGIFSVIAAIANGYLLGFVSSLAVKESSLLELWRLLPHGIFELPAVFISLGLGLRFGTFVFQKKKGEAFRNYLWNSIRVFLFVIIPLLIIAAVIEGGLIFSFG